MTWRPGGPDDSNECMNPRYLREHGFFVRCGVCQRCRVLRGKDWAGRAIAESQVADRTIFTTLTIGGDRLFGRGIGDNIRAREFQKEDVQAYVKRLRRHIAGRGKNKTGAKMRMFYVGENGDRKGRVHYHMLQYFYGTQGPKDLLLNTYYFHGKMDEGIVEATPNIIHRDGTYTFWPHGLVYYREFQPRHAYYLATYVTKVYRSEDGEGERTEYTRPGVSTKPLLGAKWFKWLALRYVEQRLSPQSRTYSFSREAGYKGSLASYWMGDATFALFVRAFVEGWQKAYGDEPWPYSPVLDEHLQMVDDQQAARRPYEWEAFDEHHHAVVEEKADFRAEVGMVRLARETIEDGLRMERAGVKLVVKRDGVDDALNAALAISDEADKRRLIGSGRVDLRPGGSTIAEQEAEWIARFGRFEDHEKRWQAEVLRRRR